MTEPRQTDLVCVKYASQSLINGDLGTLETLRNTCVFRNAQRDITGALYYDMDWFFQILEGPRNDVEVLIRSLRTDARHADMRILQSGGITKRTFSRWSMKFISGLPETCVGTPAAFDLSNPDQALVERLSVYLLSA